MVIFSESFIHRMQKKKCNSVSKSETNGIHETFIEPLLKFISDGTVFFIAAAIETVVFAIANPFLADANSIWALHVALLRTRMIPPRRLRQGTNKNWQTQTHSSKPIGSYQTQYQSVFWKRLILLPLSLPLPPKCSIIQVAIPPTNQEAANTANRFRFRFQNLGSNAIYRS